MIVLTDGFYHRHTAKTAICVVRYRSRDVAAVLDSHHAGKTCQELMGCGGEIPVIGSLAGAPPGADALLIGIAPPGGKIPQPWRAIVLEAIRRGMNIIAGLHEFLNDDAEFAEAAAQHGVTLTDLRDCDHRDVAHRQGIREDCLRIHTVGNDCSVGKMVASVEVAQGLRQRGFDAQFVATGQTGILVAGGGIAIDRVVSDFVSGAAEKLVLDNQHHEIIVVEGQGSLFHPRYSGVTLGLLHGVIPHGLILVYEMGRTQIYGMEPLPLAPLDQVIAVYESAASLMHPCQVIGVAVNGQNFHDTAVDEECAGVEAQLNLPVCDVIRHGPGKLVDAVMALSSAGKTA